MSLYRIYRPKIFADVVGQEHIKTTLQNELATNSTVHAYLFSGPRAVGKTSTARILARAVNCEKRKAGESEPCNACQSCVSLLENKTLDALEIDAASYTGIDNMRDTIIAASRVGHTNLRIKVFIIDEVHMLSMPAFNALLKTLEEPPSNTLFILATTELQKVPVTIISRCQRFDFKKISPDAMIERLEKIAKAEKRVVDRDVLEFIAHSSTGCQRDAESLLEQLFSFPDKKITMAAAGTILPLSDYSSVLKLIKFIIEKDTAKGIALVNELAEAGRDLPTFTNDVVELLRDILLIKNGASDVVQRSSESKKELGGMAEKFNSQEILSLVDFFVQANGDTRWFTIPQLPLEMAVVRSCESRLRESIHL